MFKKLRQKTNDMKAVAELMTTAEGFARADGAERPGSERLVAAAIHHSDGKAAAIAEQAGISAESFLAEVRRAHAEALTHVGIDGKDATLDAALGDAPDASGIYRAAPSAQDLMQQVAASANGFDSAHVLREANKLKRGTTANAFKTLGLDKVISAAQIDPS